MTTSNKRTNGCIFQWKLENLSHCCWLGNGEELVSPTFDKDAVHGAEWSLHLYPMGSSYCKNSIVLFLQRGDDGGPKYIEADYQLAFLRKDGTVLKEYKESESFKRGEGSSLQESLEKVFLTQRKEFLPEDALTVQCMIQEKDEEGTLVKFKHTYVRTVFKVKRRSVLWKIDKFGTLGSSLNKKFKDNLIDLDLILNKDTFSLVVNSHDDSVKCISVNISIIDSEGIKTNCRVAEINGRNVEYSSFLDDDVVEYGKFNDTPYHIARIREKLMEHKSRYMPNDVLSLYIEYVISTATNSFESFGSETISPK